MNLHEFTWNSITSTPPSPSTQNSFVLQVKGRHSGSQICSKTQNAKNSTFFHKIIKCVFWGFGDVRGPNWGFGLAFWMSGPGSIQIKGSWTPETANLTSKSPGPGQILPKSNVTIINPEMYDPSMGMYGPSMWIIPLSFLGSPVNYS